jgi:hypothetical protein
MITFIRKIAKLKNLIFELPVGGCAEPWFNSWYRYRFGTKEWGHYKRYYTYPTVLVRNAANLAHLQSKASKFRNGNKFYYFVFNCPF